MQLFGGQKPPCWWAKCMAFPTPLANSQPVHLPVNAHQLFRTMACSSRSECTRCVVFFSLASLSEYSGRLATHGWNFVWHTLCDGGMLHSLPMIDLLHAYYTCTCSVPLTMIVLKVKKKIHKFEWFEINTEFTRPILH